MAKKRKKKNSNKKKAEDKKPEPAVEGDQNDAPEAVHHTTDGVNSRPLDEEIIGALPPAPETSDEPVTDEVSEDDETKEMKVVDAPPPVDDFGPYQPKGDPPRAAPEPVKTEPVKGREKYRSVLGGRGKIKKGYKLPTVRRASRQAAMHKIKNRPFSAPLAKDCIAEYETKTHYIFKLRNNKKVIIEKPKPVTVKK